MQRWSANYSAFCLKKKLAPNNPQLIHHCWGSILDMFTIKSCVSWQKERSSPHFPKGKKSRKSAKEKTAKSKASHQKVEGRLPNVGKGHGPFFPLRAQKDVPVNSPEEAAGSLAASRTPVQTGRPRMLLARGGITRVSVTSALGGGGGGEGGGGGGELGEFQNRGKWGSRNPASSAVPSQRVGR